MTELQETLKTYHMYKTHIYEDIPKAQTFRVQMTVWSLSKGNAQVAGSAPASVGRLDDRPTILSTKHLRMMFLKHTISLANSLSHPYIHILAQVVYLHK